MPDIAVINWQGGHQARQIHYLQVLNTTQEVSDSSNPSAPPSTIDTSADTFLLVCWQEWRVPLARLRWTISPGAFDDSTQQSAPPPETESNPSRVAGVWRPAKWTRNPWLNGTIQDVDGVAAPPGSADGTEPPEDLWIINWQGEWKASRGRVLTTFSQGAFDDSVNIEPDTFTPIIMRPAWWQGNPPIRLLAQLQWGSSADDSFVAGVENAETSVYGRWAGLQYNQTVVGFLQNQTGVSADESLIADQEHPQSQVYGRFKPIQYSRLVLQYVQGIPPMDDDGAPGPAGISEAVIKRRRRSKSLGSNTP